MDTYWLLAANEGRARVFEITPSNATWTEVEDCISPVAPQPMQASFGQAEPHELDAQRFASSLVKDLKKAQEAGRFQRLDIAAPPSFLGFLQEALPDALKQSLGYEWMKDWARLDISEIARRYGRPTSH